mmetsp:Transcript_2693/g.4895  ORF Transcript_2693/g.4895 Transcript_2693/m.4895 type:complete len:201 (-) Transcript_2693:925-1527(-)
MVDRMKRGGIGLVVVWFVLVSTSQGCSCVIPSVYRSYYSDYIALVAKAKVLRKSRLDALTVKYDMQLRMMFKSCPPRKVFSVYTTSQSAACGVRFRVGSVVVLFASRQAGRYRVGLCDLNQPWGKLSKAEKSFLLGRELTCRGVNYCGSGGEVPPLGCPEGCPACALSNPSIVCETSLCRGCGLEAAFLYNASTFEPVSC